MEGFEVGDIVVAYIKGEGYVGIGRVTQEAMMVRDVKIDGKRLLDLPLKAKEMAYNSNNINRSEYVVLVRWIRSVPQNEARWKPKSKLFTSRLVRASMEDQEKTLAFINKSFCIKLQDKIK
jgi:hypothetical protein